MNKRQKETAKAQLEAEKEVLKKLEGQYKTALNDINKKIKEFDYDINMLDQSLNQDGLDDAAKTVIQSMKRSKIYQKQYQEAMQGQVSGILDKLHGDEYATIQQYLKNSYTDAFVGTAYDLAGQGIPLIMPIDQASVVKAIQTDSKVSKGLYNALGVDVAKLKKSIQSEISRGIATGMSYADIARNISNVSKAPLNRANVIARTEGHRIQQASTMDAQRSAKKKGADVVKQWDSTLDGKTRPTHRQLDGQIREVDEPFEADGMKADAPGYFGDPAEDCNCRCACLTRARWALDEDELQTLKDRAEYFGLDKTKSFDDFKGKYLKAAEQVAKEDITASKFVHAKTIEEAEEFAGQFIDTSRFGSVGVSYKGVHLDIANEINQTLNDFYSKFDVGKLGGIAAPAKNTKLGKMVNAHAAYSPVGRNLLLDRNKTKNVKTMLSALRADQEALTSILTNPEKYDFNKLSKRILNVIEASKETGRSIVPNTIGESITHELGHFLESQIKKEDFEIIKAGMGKYATGISGYATDSVSEYVAESFASYMKGEDRIDPAVRKIFDGLRK